VVLNVLVCRASLLDTSSIRSRAVVAGGSGRSCRAIDAHVRADVLVSCARRGRSIALGKHAIGGAEADVARCVCAARSTSRDRAAVGGSSTEGRHVIVGLGHFALVEDSAGVVVLGRGGAGASRTRLTRARSGGVSSLGLDAEAGGAIHARGEDGAGVVVLGRGGGEAARARLTRARSGGVSSLGLDAVASGAIHARRVTSRAVVTRSPGEAGRAILASPSVHVLVRRARPGGAAGLCAPAGRVAAGGNVAFGRARGACARGGRISPESSNVIVRRTCRTTRSKDGACRGGVAACGERKASSARGACARGGRISSLRRNVVVSGAHQARGVSSGAVVARGSCMSCWAVCADIGSDVLVRRARRRRGSFHRQKGAERDQRDSRDCTNHFASIAKPIERTPGKGTLRFQKPFKKRISY